MSKRKFQVTKSDVNDDEHNVVNSNFDSGSLFVKYKKSNTEDSEAAILTTTEKLSPMNSEEMHCNKRVLDKQDNTSKSTRRFNVGQSFAETFSFLKQSDMFELPPEPKQPEKPSKQNTNSIIVNSKQRGNPILKHIRNIPWEFGEIIPDYEVGLTSCALFLSLRYHNLNPEYIHERLKQLGNRYVLRILLAQVDVKNTGHSLKELGKIAMLANCTLILAWSPEEAGRYLETYKTYENKPPDVLQERVEGDYLSKVQELLTTIKSINKTDVLTLLSTFKSLKGIANATKEEISLCPGFGPQKAQRLYKAFNEPFKRTKVVNSITSRNNDNLSTISVSCEPKMPVGALQTETPEKKLETQIIKPLESSSSSDQKKQKTLSKKKLPAEDNALDVLQLKPTDNSGATNDQRLSKTEAVYKSGLSKNKRDKNILNTKSYQLKSSLSETITPSQEKRFEVKVLSVKKKPLLNSSNETSCITTDVSIVKTVTNCTNEETLKSGLIRHINTNIGGTKIHTSAPQTLLRTSHRTEISQEEWNNLVASSDDEES